MVVILIFFFKFNSVTTEPGLSSATEEETSGYESEGVRSPSPTSPLPSDRTSPASPPSGRRPRTAFTAEQISTMEKAFKRNAYLGTQDKAELCKKLSLSDKQVSTPSFSSASMLFCSIGFCSFFPALLQIRNWFQNRRMKLKRTVQDALAHACQASVASQLMHYPELQSYRPGPYSRYHTAAPVAAPDVPPPVSYVHPHSLQYSSPLPSVSSHNPMDSYYQYSSLPSVPLPSSSTQVTGSYPTYPQYY